MQFFSNQKMIMPFSGSRAFTKGLSTDDLIALLETVTLDSTLKPLSNEQSEREGSAPMTCQL